MALDQKIIEDIKKADPWLIPFDLSDQELYDVDVLSSRARAGSDDLSDLIPNLKVKISSKPEEIINQIALSIAINKLWPMRKYISTDVGQFIKSLGGTPPIKKKKVIKKTLLEKAPTDYLIKAETNTSQNGSKAMTFSTMDEEEVKKIAVPEGETYKLDYDTLADDIISKFGYNESDEILHKRLSNIIISRFRDVRDEIESVEALTKSHKVGGMEFTKEQADALLKLIKEEQKEFKQYHISSGDGIQRIAFKSKTPQFIKPEIKVKTLQEKRAEEMGKQGVTSEISVSNMTDVSQSVPVITKQPEVSKIQDTPTPPQSSPQAWEEGRSPIMDEEDGLPILRMPEDLMVKPEIIKLNKVEEKKEEIKKPSFNDVLPVEPIKEVELENHNFVEEKSIPTNFVHPVPKKEESAPLPQPAPYVVPKSIPPRVIESQNTRRPIVDGIKLAKKLTGPIEELSEMTLIDFRRLASDPVSATGSVREKINLLQEESYVRRIEGINAWFGNEINRFYRLLGQTSMAEGKSIDNIIKDRLVSGKPTLSLEEFDAVMQLNSELRY